MKYDCDIISFKTEIISENMQIKIFPRTDTSVVTVTLGMVS
jgi:hypothetical protein